MKRLFSLLLCLAMIFSCTAYVSAEAPQKEAIKVKVYSANNSGISISATDASKSVSTQMEIGESTGLWCENAIAFTSNSGIENTTFDYVDSFTDSSLDIQMSPNANTFMVYVDMPEFLGDTAAISLLDVKLKQNGKEVSVSTAKSFYSYMNVFDGVWVKDASVAGELNSIGRGFKGYIKFNIKELGGFKEVSSSIDFSKAYTVSGIKIGYNHVGGEFGKLIVGGYFGVLEDADTTYITNVDKSETLCAEVLGGDFDFNGKFDKADLEVACKLAIGKSDVSKAALLQGDVKKDGTDLGASDLVRLKKNIEGIEIESETIVLNPSTAEKDKEITAKNPDRGYRMKVIMNMKEDDPEKFLKPIDEYPVMFKSEADKDNVSAWVNPTCIKLYFHLTKWNDDKVLPAEATDKIKLALSHIREIGQTVLIRFVYQEGHVEVEDQATNEIIYAHLDQLAPIFEEYKDIINCHELGLLGAFGEWHSYGGGYFTDKNKTNGRLDFDKIWANYEWDEVEIIKKACDTTPEEIPILLRYSYAREKFLEKYPEYKNRIGLLNDAYFGIMDNYGAFPYEDQRSEDTLAAYKASLYAPYSGEFMWGAEWFDERTGNAFPRVKGEQAILGFKFFHQNTFSTWHNSWEGKASIAKGAWHQTEREGDMALWSKTKMDEKWLKANNIFYAPNWFKDADGNAVNRSQYEFVRDYLGYKLEGKDVTITGKLKKNRAIDVKMNLVNYGFSAAYNMTSEFVILDKDNKIVSRVSAGNPSEWSNSSCLETHTISGQLKLPSKGGKYKLALYVHNRAGTGAYIGNDIEWSGEYNILKEFKL